MRISTIFEQSEKENEVATG